MKHTNTKAIVGTGILTALVLILQLWIAQSIKIGTFSITLVLVPIVVGAALYGWKSGVWLGFVFGLATLADAAPFFAISYFGTIATCLTKGVLAGLAAALVYKAFEKKNRYVAVFLAGLVCPIVNTGIFVLGTYIFFFDAMKEASIANNYASATEYIFMSYASLS